MGKLEPIPSLGEGREYREMVDNPHVDCGDMQTQDGHANSAKKSTLGWPMGRHEARK